MQKVWEHRDYRVTAKINMPFATHMVWKEPKIHVDDCCFCITNVEGQIVKSKKNITHPNIPSVTGSVAHDQSLLVPISSTNTE